MIIYALAGKIEKSQNRKNPENRFLAIKSLIFVKTVLYLVRIRVSLRTNRTNLKSSKICPFPDFTSIICQLFATIFFSESSKPYNPVQIALKPR